MPVPMITIDFVTDWCEIQKAELARMGYALKPGDTYETISFAFFNVHWRQIPAHPRTIIQSPELNCPCDQRKGSTC